MQKYGHSQVDVNVKIPHFHDEFKIRLPAVITPQHHVLFTFFHVDLQMKLEAPKPVSDCYVIFHLLSKRMPLIVMLCVLQSWIKFCEHGCKDFVVIISLFFGDSMSFH